jgi:hypothetical protein
MQSYQFIL